MGIDNTVTKYEDANQSAMDKQDEFTKNANRFKSDHKELLSKVDGLRMGFEDTHIHIDHSRRINRALSDVFALILTANETERETLFAYFTKQQTTHNLVKENVVVKYPVDGLVYSCFYINDIKVVHVEPEMTGSYTWGGTAQTLKKALKRVKPSIVVSVGVAFGYDIKKQTLGDVLVGRQFFSYDKSTKVKGHTLDIKKLHIFESDENLRIKMKSCMKFEDKLDGCFANKFQAHLGNILTGEYVVDSIDFREMIYAPFRTFGIIGGEMEAFGMFSVIDENNKSRYRHDVHGIMIKGICDWGAGKNGSESGNVSTDDKNENEKARIEEKKRLNAEREKNDLQVLAMCNACTVCERFLCEKRFFSDYKIHGTKKRFWRGVKAIKNIFTQK